MKFGLCASHENIPLAARLGFDYVELAAAAVEALSGPDFAALKAAVDASPIKVERCNTLFPGAIRLVGPDADPAKTRAYLDRALPRVRALGASVVVFGSGRSRAFPPGRPFRDSYRELVAVTRLIGDAAADAGLSIAIEPLNRAETNCVNSLPEGAMLEADANHPAVGLLADLYHILKDNEPITDILAVRELRHTHIALLEGRAFPTVVDRDVAAFFSALKAVGYDGAMSIEGACKNLEQDAAAALAALKSAAASA